MYALKRERKHPQQPEEVVASETLEEHEADVLPDANPRRNPEDRHGQFLIRQLKPEHRRILHEITLTSQNILQGDDLEGGQPLQRGDISYFSLWLMISNLHSHGWGKSRCVAGVLVLTMAAVPFFCCLASPKRKAHVWLGRAPSMATFLQRYFL